MLYEYVSCNAMVSNVQEETIVTFTFAEEGGSSSVKMIQPFGENDIWVPQTDVHVEG